MDTNDPRIIRSLLNLEECSCTADDYADCSSRGDIYACGYLNSSPHSANGDSPANIGSTPRDDGDNADSDSHAR